MRLRAQDPGEPGTARFRRVVELRGKTQREIGEQCRPAQKQAVVHQFEFAQTPLTWPRAKQFAAGYYSEIFRGLNGKAANPELATLLVWELWFANVAAYGSDDMQSLAARLKPTIQPALFTHDLTLWDLVPKEGSGVTAMPVRAAQLRAGYA